MVKTGLINKVGRALMPLIAGAGLYCGVANAQAECKARPDLAEIAKYTLQNGSKDEVSIGTPHSGEIKNDLYRVKLPLENGETYAEISYIDKDRNKNVDGSDGLEIYIKNKSSDIVSAEIANFVLYRLSNDFPRNIVSYVKEDITSGLPFSCRPTSECDCDDESNGFGQVYKKKYDYTPFSQIRNPNLLQKNIKSLDEESISYIKKLDSHGFVENCDKKEKTICGKYAIACGLEILNELNVKKVRIINYSTSAEITKDTESSVSYCSIIFE